MIELSDKSRRILSDINPDMVNTKAACEEVLSVIATLQDRVEHFENEYGYECTAHDVLEPVFADLTKAVELLSRVEAGMYGESSDRTELREFLKFQEKRKQSAW